MRDAAKDMALPAVGGINRVHVNLFSSQLNNLLEKLRDQQLKNHNLQKREAQLRAEIFKNLEFYN